MKQFSAAWACGASSGMTCIARGNAGRFTQRVSALLFRPDARILSECLREFLFINFEGAAAMHIVVDT
jgi:hypothetical protein